MFHSALRARCTLRSISFHLTDPSSLHPSFYSVLVLQSCSTRGLSHKPRVCALPLASSSSHVRLPYAPPRRLKELLVFIVVYHSGNLKAPFWKIMTICNPISTQTQERTTSKVLLGRGTNHRKEPHTKKTLLECNGFREFRSTKITETEMRTNKLSSIKHNLASKSTVVE